MSTKLNSVPGGMAGSLATKTLLVASYSSAPANPTVQSQQTSTANSHRVTSSARTFATARKPHQLFKA